MSAIRPDLSPIQFPPAGQAPTRAARSDFFKAALDAVQSAPIAPASRAAAAQPTSTIAQERPTRPGALLDIRV